MKRDIRELLCSVRRAKTKRRRQWNRVGKAARFSAALVGSLAALKDLYFRRKVRHKNVVLLEVFSERLSVKLHQRLPFVVRHVGGIERRFVTHEAQPWFVLGLRQAVFLISIRKDRIRHDKR